MRLSRACVSLDRQEIKSLASWWNLFKSISRRSNLNIVQRYKLYTRTRQAGETVHQFVVALRNLSKHCNFGTTLNTMMRDRLVVAMIDEKIQRKLLQEAGLTFEKSPGNCSGDGNYKQESEGVEQTLSVLARRK